MKKRAILAGLVCTGVLTAVIFVGWGDAIFQRGNPLPYLLAMTHLNETTPYALVMEKEKYDVYITKREEQKAMLSAIEVLTESKFVDQGGRSFFFENEEKHFVVTNEVYWGNYLVWDIENWYNQ